MKLNDPGKGKTTREHRKQERLAVWKRPTTANNRTKGTSERKADWEGYIK